MSRTLKYQYTIFNEAWYAHPDHGGSDAAAARLNAAMDAIRKERSAST
jgi:hypothetical protein